MANICEHSWDEVCKITGEVVKLAAVTMQKCKGDVTWSYTSDAIRNAPVLLFDRPMFSEVGSVTEQ